MKNLTKIISLFLLIAFSVLKSQQIIIKDSLDGKPLAFSQIIIGQNSYYADSLGQFRFIDEVPSFIVKKPGYESKLVKNFKKDILLSPKMFEIPEVEIRKKELMSVENKLKRNLALTIPVGWELGFILKNPHDKTGIIKEINIPIKKVFENKNAQLIIQFYNFEGDEIEHEPIPNSETIISVNKLTKNKNTFNILNKSIEISPKGIFISLKVVEESGISKFTEIRQSISFICSKEKSQFYYYDFEKNVWKSFNQEPNTIGISYTAFY